LIRSNCENPLDLGTKLSEIRRVFGFSEVSILVAINPDIILEAAKNISFLFPDTEMVVEGFADVLGQQVY
jgi:hypothetical protein